MASGEMTSAEFTAFLKYIFQRMPQFSRDGAWMVAQKSRLRLLSAPSIRSWPQSIQPTCSTLCRCIGTVGLLQTVDLSASIESKHSSNKNAEKCNGCNYATQLRIYSCGCIS
jgi:hypothetical protein